MLPLGLYCVATGAVVAVAASRFRRYRTLFERLGGGLVLTGLGFVGANLMLIA